MKQSAKMKIISKDVDIRDVDTNNIQPDWSLFGKPHESIKIWV